MIRIIVLGGTLYWGSACLGILPSVLQSSTVCLVIRGAVVLELSLLLDLLHFFGQTLQGRQVIAIPERFFCPHREKPEAQVLLMQPPAIDQVIMVHPVVEDGNLTAEQPSKHVAAIASYNFPV